MIQKKEKGNEGNWGDLYAGGMKINRGNKNLCVVTKSQLQHINSYSFYFK